jgi:hypothetical protein
MSQYWIENYMSLSYYFKYHDLNLDMYNFVEFCDNNNVYLNYTCFVYSKIKCYASLCTLIGSKHNEKYIVAFDNLNSKRFILITIKDIISENNSIYVNDDQTEFNIEYNNKCIIVTCLSSETVNKLKVCSSSQQNYTCQMGIVGLSLPFLLSLGNAMSNLDNLFESTIKRSTSLQKFKPTRIGSVPFPIFLQRYVPDFDISKSNYELEMKYIKSKKYICVGFINCNDEYKKLSVQKYDRVVINCDWINNAIPHENIFPDTVMMIKFGENFNNVINTNCLPQFLKKLILVEYKHKFLVNTFPTKLESLLIIDYEHTINNLPVNLQKLYIGNNVAQQVIPSCNLKTLYLGSCFTKTIPMCLKKLYCKLGLVKHYPKIGDLSLYLIDINYGMNYGSQFENFIVNYYEDKLIKEILPCKVIIKKKYYPLPSKTFIKKVYWQQPPKYRH